MELSVHRSTWHKAWPSRSIVYIPGVISIAGLNWAWLSYGGEALIIQNLAESKAGNTCITHGIMGHCLEKACRSTHISYDHLISHFPGTPNWCVHLITHHYSLKLTAASLFGVLFSFSWCSTSVQPMDGANTLHSEVSVDFRPIGKLKHYNVTHVSTSRSFAFDCQCPQLDTGVTCIKWLLFAICACSALPSNAKWHIPKTERRSGNSIRSICTKTSSSADGFHSEPPLLGQDSPWVHLEEVSLWRSQKIHQRCIGSSYTRFWLQHQNNGHWSNNPREGLPALFKASYGIPRYWSFVHELLSPIYVKIRKCNSTSHQPNTPLISSFWSLVATLKKQSLLLISSHMT